MRQGTPQEVNLVERLTEESAIAKPRHTGKNSVEDNVSPKEVF
jgi:hypothetical protein